MTIHEPGSADPLSPSLVRYCMGIGGESFHHPTATPAMTAATTFQVPFFPEIITREQLAAMSKPRLGEILFRTGHNRNQSYAKAELVDMVCFVLKIYGNGRA